MLTGGRGIDGIDRLDFRLVALLGLALLPIGLIAMVQTYRVISEADRTAEAALLGATLSAARIERESILRVRGAAEVTARVAPILLDEPEMCANRLSAFAAEARNVAIAAIIDADGNVACASDGIGMDVSDSHTYTAWSEDPAPRIDAIVGRISQAKVIAVTEPIYEGDVSTGYVVFSVPQAALTLPNEDLSLAPAASLTFTGDGEFLWTPGDVDQIEALLPADRALDALGADEPVIFRAASVAGRDQVYAVAPLIPGEIYAMSIWPRSATRAVGVTAASAILFPLLMWLVTIGVAYSAVHRLVVRHIRFLRLRIRAFTANRKILAPTYSADTPTELREVIETFHRMTERIVHDEADLENSLHEKDVLLKEVHHRVKNNLQLIASMMNMQLRKAQSAETRFVLRRLQDRVLGLATIHRNLYRATVLSRVDSGDLVTELVEQSLRNAKALVAGVDMRVNVDRIPLYPDQAVPLALLVTETVTNALKYVGSPPNGNPWIELSLTLRDDESVKLRVANSTGDLLDPEAEAISTGLGTQLMGAFVLQLDATSKVEEHEDAFVVEVLFRPSDFSKSE